MGRPNVNWNVGNATEKHSTYTSKVVKAGIPFAEQVTESDMKYIIKYDFDLGGETVTMPENCILEFDGGSLNNGTLTGGDVITDIDELLGKVTISNLNIKNAKTLLASDFVGSNYYNGTRDNVHLVNGGDKVSRFIYKVKPGDIIYVGSLLNDIQIGVYTYTEDFKERGVIGYSTSINQPILIPEGVYYVFFAIYRSYFGNEGIDSLRIYTSCKNGYVDIIDKATYNLPATISSKTIGLSSHLNMWISYSTGIIHRGGNYYSYIVSKDVFKGYTNIRITANDNYRLYWGALKEYPTGEYAVFCNDTPSLLGLGKFCIMDIPIPSDCEYLWIAGYYGSGGADEDCTPKSVVVYSLNTSSVGKIDDSLKKEVGISSNVHNQQLSINVCHWNMGHLSSNGETMYSTITDEDFEEKRAAFSSIIPDMSHNFFFNEYEDVFARLSDGNYYTQNLIPYYLDKRLGSRRHGIWNAAYLQTPYKAIRQTEFKSYYGKVRENNSTLLQYDTYYTIYLFFIGGKNVYLVHTHYPLAGSVGVGNHNKGFDDIIEATQNYARVVIFGDLNIRDTSYLESKGFTVANDLSKPTYHDNTILDWVLYRGDITIEDFDVVDAISTGLSDHNIVKFKVVTTPLTPNIIGETTLWPAQNNLKPIWFNGEYWIHADGESMNIRRIGTSAQRPVPAYAPFMYFDTSIVPPRPIFWNGESWVDATGTTV